MEADIKPVRRKAEDSTYPYLTRSMRSKHDEYVC